MDGIRRRSGDAIRRASEARSFRTEQRELALHAPEVTGEAAVFAHHGVARHAHRERIRGASLADFLRLARRADAFGGRAVALLAAGGDLLQRVPDAQVEVAA